MNHRVQIVILLLAPSLALAGGGIRNGGLQGVVYDSMGGALSGVSVVAVREVEPRLIRNATTDAQGNYFLGSMPLGTWVIGFSRFGFRTLDTQSGDPENRSAVGSQVRVFIESGQLVTAPPVNLQEEAITRSATLQLTLLDATSGEPVTDATVVSGASSVDTADASGTYDLPVSVRFDENGQPIPVPVSIFADGFDPLESSELVAPEGSSRPRIFRLEPQTSLIIGTVRLPPDTPPERITEVSLTAVDLDPDRSRGQVEDSGSFSIRLPASTDTRRRRYTLLFALQGHETARVEAVMPPRTGARTLPPVVLEPLDPPADPGPDPEP